MGEVTLGHSARREHYFSVRWWTGQYDPYGGELGLSLPHIRRHQDLRRCHSILHLDVGGTSTPIIPNELGLHVFFCDIHPYMFATVIVVDPDKP